MLGRPGTTLEVRELSPVPGTSILMTSAPRSAISIYGTVPACAVEQATTLTPCNGPCGSVISNDLQRTKQCGDVRRSAKVVYLLQAHFDFLAIEPCGGAQGTI